MVQMRRQMLALHEARPGCQALVRKAVVLSMAKHLSWLTRSRWSRRHIYHPERVTQLLTSRGYIDTPGLKNLTCAKQEDNLVCAKLPST